MLKAKQKQNKKQASSSLLCNNCLTFHCTHCLLTVIPFLPDWWSGEERVLNWTFWFWGPLPLLDTRTKAPAEQAISLLRPLSCWERHRRAKRSSVRPRPVFGTNELNSQLLGVWPYINWRGWTRVAVVTGMQAPPALWWECLKGNDSAKHLLFVAAPLAQSPAVAEAYPVMLAMNAADVYGQTCL